MDLISFGPEEDEYSDLQEKLTSVPAKAVKELNLDWDALVEPARSKLDTWYFQSSRRLAALRRRAPFFPDIHKQVVKFGLQPSQHTSTFPHRLCVATWTG